MTNGMDALPIGRLAHVNSVRGDQNIRQRLLDLGFTAGAPVTCLFESPHGNPRAYEVRGAIIALRNDDASSIRIRGA